METAPEILIYDEIFNEVYFPYIDLETKTQIFFGGASSGKSVFLAQRCVYDILKGMRNYLVVRQVARTIRGSVFTEILKVISDWDIAHLFKINKSDMLISCTKNGRQIIFAGLDDVEKLKSLVPLSGAITDIWVEEATEVDRNSLKQLLKRQRGGDRRTTKRVMLSFNPILQTHWIYDEYFKAISWADDQTVYRGDDLFILKTWYIHNCFLTEEDVAALMKESDKYFRDVYTFGNWGVIGNIIFTNWEVRDLSDMQAQFVNLRHGLDFGFSSDPAAIISSHYDRAKKEIYIYDEFYSAGLTNDLLAQEVLDICGKNLVVCDSAEPKSILELKQHGVSAVAAQKGKDSVLHGIQWLQQHKIFIDTRCINTRNEFLQYKWAEDRYGNAVRRPVDRDNHLIDALRYAYEADSRGNPRKASSRQG